MTISYTPGWKLFIRWKGSIWKAICLELFVFLVLYYVVRTTYWMLESDYKRRFEHLSSLFDSYTKSFPLTFLLGFYVSMIASRWWTQFMNVTWPDDLLCITCAIWPGAGENNVRMRHTIARYINLAITLCWRDVSVVVRERFPTFEHLVKSGLMTDKELDAYNLITATSLQWQLPIQWIQRFAEDDYVAGRLPAPLYTTFLHELKAARHTMRVLYCHDWVPVPLVYTQVVAIATYSYFAFALIGHQFLDPHTSGDKIDLYFPFYTVVQFLFYVGWFRVGQDLMRPFGTDDDDIELNYVLDRNVAASFSLVHQASTQRMQPDPTDAWRTSPLFTNGEPDIAGCTLAHTTQSRATPIHPPKQLATVALRKADQQHDTIVMCQDNLHAFDRRGTCATCREKRKPNRRDF